MIAKVKIRQKEQKSKPAGLELDCSSDISLTTDLALRSTTSNKSDQPNQNNNSNNNYTSDNFNNNCSSLPKGNYLQDIACMILGTWANQHYHWAVIKIVVVELIKCFINFKHGDRDENNKLKAKSKVSELITCIIINTGLNQISNPKAL